LLSYFFKNLAKKLQFTNTIKNLLKKLIATSSEIVRTHFDAADVIKFISAARAGHFEVIRWYVSVGIDVNATDEMKNNALILSACYGHKQIVNFLIQHNAKINMANKHGETALIWAADKGHKEIVKTLIDHKANLHAVNHFGQSALFWAKQNGHKEVVNILEEATSPKVIHFSVSA